MQSKRLPQPEEYFSYDRLEKASKKLHLNPTVPENEERLMNLHNHLICYMAFVLSRKRRDSGCHFLYRYSRCNE